MRRARTVLAALLSMFALALASCDPGAECLESCDEDDDCIAGHACIRFVDGKQCAPIECKACESVCSFAINPHAEAVKHCIWEGCDGE